MHITLSMVALVMALGILPAAMSAGAQNRPCAAELQSLCPEARRGDREVMDRCLQEHAQRLSPVCRERIETMRERGALIREVCADEIERFCDGADPHAGHFVPCLRPNEAALSPACRDAVMQGRRLRGGLKYR